MMTNKYKHKNIMINLKLAQYEGEKFERFLYQEDSEYFPPDWENFITHIEIGERFNFENTKFLLGKDFVGFRYCIPYEGDALKVFKRDKKDPLNRFNGLFDGLTYGEGRFVLIEILNNALSEHDIVNSPIEDGFSFQGLVKKFPSGFGIINKHGSYKLLNVYEEIFWDKIGNLHENPELYEKIK